MSNLPPGVTQVIIDGLMTSGLSTAAEDALDKIADVRGKALRGQRQLEMQWDDDDPVLVRAFLSAMLEGVDDVLAECDAMETEVWNAPERGDWGIWT